MSRTYSLYRMMNKARGNILCAAPMVFGLCALIFFTFFVSLPMVHYTENVPLSEGVRDKGVILSGKPGYEDSSYYLSRRGVSANSLLLTLAVASAYAISAATAAVSYIAAPREAAAPHPLFLQQNLPLLE